MADEIIDFYKKAKEQEEPQKPIEEQKETPVPEIPKPDEPFDRFLLELAEKLQKEKVITEKQQETFVEQIKEPVSIDPNENDPFKKFIGSFANILKEDQLVNREENIKEATINFINKLKEQPDEPFIIKDEQLVKSKKQKYLPPKIAKKVQKLPQPVKKEEPVVEEQADELVKEEPKDENKYVKELKTADKTNKKLPEKVKSVSDIKSIVEKQVAEILSRYPNLGFTGGGGGTNAVQYAEGGTMNGNLTVNGTVNATTYLSGGVNLYNLLSSSGGGGEADRLISGSASLVLTPNGTIDFPDDTIRPSNETILTLESENPSLSSYTRIALSPYAFFAYDNEGNSITFDEVDNAIVLTSQDEHEWTFNKEGVLEGPHGALTVNSLSSLGQILSGGVPLHDIFLTAETDSQNLTFTESSAELSISNGNTVILSALSGQKFDQSLNTEDEVQFAKITVNPNQGPLEIDGTGLLWSGSRRWDVETGVLNVYDNNTSTPISVIEYGGNADSGSTPAIPPVKFYAAIEMAGDDAALNIETTKTNLGLGTADSVEFNQVNANVYLSGGTNLLNILSSTGGGENSQTLVYSTLTEELSITNGNSVSLSSLSDKSYANSNFLKLSGGTISGNLTVQGNISALGTATFANTIFTTTSALSVYNTGPGPALYVFQASGPYDVASFYDGDGIEVLHVGNAGPGGFGKVGVNESFPNEELTVRGSISATETIYANRIGIGTSDPNSALAVSGTISSTGSILATAANFSGDVNANGVYVLQNVELKTYSTNRGSIGRFGNTMVWLGPTAFAINTDYAPLGLGPVAAPDVFLTRDAANIFAQRNGLNPQTFRIYNTYTAGTPVSSEFGYTQWSGNTFQIGTSATGGGQNRDISIFGGTSPRITVTASNGNVAVNGATFWGNNSGAQSNSWNAANQAGIDNYGLRLGSLARIGWTGGQYFHVSSYDTGVRRMSAGLIEINNGTDFNYRDLLLRGLYFEGTSFSFPSIKRSGTGLQIRLADDTAFAPLTASNITATNYLSAGVNLLQILGPTVRQFDYVVTDGISYNYCGTAPNGSITSDSTWTIKRLLFTSAGTLLSSGTVNNSIWDNRYSYSY